VDRTPATITAVTWNVQGSAGVDIAGVAGVVGAAAADVIVVQEIGWTQSVRLARRLGMARRWVFKHWGWPHTEGLAVLTPHRFSHVRRFVLRREPWWNWRRRVAISAVVERPGGSFGVVNVHLSPHDHADERRSEAATVLGRAGRMPRAPLIAGDCNDAPDGPGPADLVAAGWIDCWAARQPRADGDGATNWTAGERRGRPPTQRLDYVFAPAGWRVVDATVLATADRFDWFAERSDHLPVRAVVEPVPV
jgi:endonuclease/exonuclease/phosphatase family metal-dependent hydrolase